ncbi:hypothetical protein OROMI_020724 [Orobanche minor]
MIGRKHKALSPLACASGSKRKKPSSSSSGKRGKALSPLACASDLFKTSTMPRDEEKPVPPHAKDDCKVNPCDGAALTILLQYSCQFSTTTCLSREWHRSGKTTRFSCEVQKFIKTRSFY